MRAMQNSGGDGKNRRLRHYLLDDIRRFTGDSAYSQIEGNLVGGEPLDSSTYEFIRNVSNMRIIERCREGLVHTDVFNMSQTVQTIIGSVLNATNISVRYGTVDENINVQIDPYIFTHSIFELMRNALQCNADTAVTIDINALEGESIVVLSVDDSGIGIEKQEIVYAFHPLYRGEKKSQC